MKESGCRVRKVEKACIQKLMDLSAKGSGKKISCKVMPMNNMWILQAILDNTSMVKNTVKANLFGLIRQCTKEIS